LIKKIISGGQTGADRAALDFAIRHKIPHGGWCPAGREAEDGVIPANYFLKESPSRDPEQRTVWNVRDSDATLIFSIGVDLKGGSSKTLEAAKAHGKPFLHLAQQRDEASAVAKLEVFLWKNHPQILNVAGPRESEEPEIARFVGSVLEAWWVNHKQ